MKKLVVGILAIVGGLAICAVAFVACVGLMSVMGEGPLPGQAILELDLEKGVVEAIPDDLVASVMFEGTPTLQQLVDTLDHAAEDRRVRALVARIGAVPMGLAHIQELRDAVARFRASGKPAVAYAETFGEFGPGNGGYYLASAFDEIYLQPSGDIGMTGLMYESPFIRGLLDKLGVVPRMGQRYEYKNAMNFYTERQYTPAHRKSMEALMDSQFGQIVRGIAQSRDLSEARVVELFDRGPYLAAEARDAGLVDGLRYRDEVLDDLRERVGHKAEVLPAERYQAHAGRRYTHGPTIALIHGYGAVTRGEGGYSPVDGSVSMGSDTVAAAFRAAVEDRRVRAIIFRVDSPGGSYVASDTIWRETIRARDANKPVIVSMGNLAGSGGYFVAMNATKIVAEPGTITASIGVLGGKMLTRGLWDKLGVTWDDVQTSAHADMWSSTHDYGEETYARFQAGLDRVYEDFTHKVAGGRGLPLERVLEVARGRIWSGEDAKNLGLVDELGGLDVALRLAREAAGLPADAAVRLKEFPRRRTQWEMLFDFTSSSGQSVPRAMTLEALRTLQPIVRTIKQLGAGREPGVLSVPDFQPPR